MILALVIVVIIVLIDLIFSVLFVLFAISVFYSFIKGAPYVPTKIKEINYILKLAQLREGQIFLDIGSGDGRVVRQAVKQYQVKGIGLDVNWFLILWARLWAKFQKLKTIEFKKMDIVSGVLPKADVIYLFLMPELIKKISPKLLAQLQNGALIISYGFEINELRKFLIKKIDHKPFATYFYRLHKMD